MQDILLEGSTTQIGLHSIKNLLGNEQQLSLFTENKPEDFAKSYGIELERQITKFGIDLTYTEHLIMEGILHGLSLTRYEGNVKPKDKLEHSKERYKSGELPEPYKYIETIPRLRASQTEILRWADINKKSAGDITRAVEALKALGTNQYCFYYTRLSLDGDGNPIKDKYGDWKKEEVMAVDTLFTISEIRDEKTKTLQYYEIMPSPIFLDQRESYFMLVPYNWREEVRALIGQKRSSSYTFRFLLFLRYQFELKRRSQKVKKPYSIKWSPEQISIAIKMPESVYRRKKARANKILEDVYSVAKRLGYLSDYKREDSLDILWLNEEKYYAPKSTENLLLETTNEEVSEEMVLAEDLYQFFLQEKRKLDPRYNPPGGHIKKSSLNHLVAILNSRDIEEAKTVLQWGLNQPYWCTRIGTPSKLRKYFHEAFSEMQASKNKGKTNPNQEQSNRLLAKKIACELSKKKGFEHKSHIEVLSKHVEIGNGLHQPTCIEYTAKGFEERLIEGLKKWGLPSTLPS